MGVLVTDGLGTDSKRRVKTERKDHMYTSLRRKAPSVSPADYDCDYNVAKRKSNQNEPSPLLHAKPKNLLTAPATPPCPLALSSAALFLSSPLLLASLPSRCSFILPSIERCSGAPTAVGSERV